MVPRAVPLAKMEPVNLNMPLVSLFLAPDASSCLPERVVPSSHYTAVRRVRDLKNQDRATRRHEADTETKHKSTTHELGAARISRGCSLDDGADDDQSGACEHAGATTKLIKRWPDEWQRNDTSNRVHVRDNS